jgi:hypothetical protein
MNAERPLKVVFFKTEAGKEPVREWLRGLSKEDSKIIGADILTVQSAWPVGKPLVDHLGDGLWEVRSQEMVLFHGFKGNSKRHRWMN